MSARHVARALAALICACLPPPSVAADLANGPDGPQVQRPGSKDFSEVADTIVGRASVIDGRTLWFPRLALKVRLAGIDTCELPQWAFDPQRHGESPFLKPVPCGPLAKAWLRRVVGGSLIVCSGTFDDHDGSLTGRCFAHERDLAIEMLRTGWARVETRSPARPEYWQWQRQAMSARYGMWATYVLDMDEWRAKAADDSLMRKPIADLNLLAERQHEITPPFLDARRRSIHSDR
ncbi:thermonuclease family protein [Mesorhizobium sp. BR1-1-9]|uniref:thermonuclease family protein n=1 Tax=unclassified Mesorhizobium TaxID=325217 RepID=UPI001CD17443|nr:MULTISPECIES: thermonuclease family protein [unclassified Mesorhizobium]MBZ9872367.1 thermonuclease family protein [Mesorhizobium sp. BR1-1-9]MBZ9944707.1 thermonuclease family protein [Mesorhizobium sp. BR1-1-13]